jgi:muconolactone delta-isomerase
MRYFVKGEFVEVGASFPLKDFVPMVENLVIPSFEAMSKLESEKKILASGIVSGGRAGMFIIDVESNKELTKLLQSLPFWGILKWKIIPLDSLKERIEVEKQMLENIKKQ